VKGGIEASILAGMKGHITFLTVFITASLVSVILHRYFNQRRRIKAFTKIFKGELIFPFTKKLMGFYDKLAYI
jgi:uncharacterized membrane protein YedE/YeeE